VCCCVVGFVCGCRCWVVGGVGGGGGGGEAEGNSVRIAGVVVSHSPVVASRYQVLTALHALHQCGGWHGRLASDCVFVDADLCVTVRGLFKTGHPQFSSSPPTTETRLGLLPAPGLDDCLHAWYDPLFAQTPSILRDSASSAAGWLTMVSHCDAPLRLLCRRG